jgi:hypothetical protein
VQEYDFKRVGVVLAVKREDAVRQYPAIFPASVDSKQLNVEASQVFILRELCLTSVWKLILFGLMPDRARVSIHALNLQHKLRTAGHSQKRVAVPQKNDLMTGRLRAVRREAIARQLKQSSSMFYFTPQVNRTLLDDANSRA